MSASNSSDCVSAVSSSAQPATFAADVLESSETSMAHKVRRHQSHLSDNAIASAAVDESVERRSDERGGPTSIEQLKLRILARSDHYVVLNKGPDERMDGAFDVTLEKALARDFPEVEKFRWIHQLDFATSGVLIVGTSKAATATCCRLFREKQVQKEYLAVVRGHLPSNPLDSADRAGAPAKACTFSKLGLLIQDMEEMERLRNQQRGSRVHQKMSGYPRGARNGPNLFTMEQARLLRESRRGDGTRACARELTPAELAFTTMAWLDLSNEEKDAYTEKAKTDKQRFLCELNEFFSKEKVRLAHQRAYGCRENTDTADEPVAYVFDAPIVEPHQSRKVFCMQVGTEANTSAKQSTTVAFVLGHATYRGQPVTKVLLRPLNGRRHQLRLHLAHHGFPIAGDVTYGSQDDEAPRMMLHAWRIWLRGCPAEKKEYGDLYFASPDPFESIVPSEREVSTITYFKHKKGEKCDARTNAVESAEPSERRMAAMAGTTHVLVAMCFFFGVQHIGGFDGICQHRRASMLNAQQPMLE
ncbi:unnamed protein product [Hyaloperonospora brassicae]|uniref:Pseudouridine synthase RsuA/RluA-like domain-containing protein n=1 Tax=Hyaloperonospora brassicae TaxID=162125 RepID=A0AAV0TZ01_HYABA|nr:unnamed protein product [Hyaloperonospora brassicae]